MVSIIVPVYNGEKFIARCVESVLAQTYTDFELILVNDGSKDNSGAICDELACKDSRIRVIHQENGGVSRARNCGLDAAKGNVIGFVDADDYIAQEMLETALREMGEVDVCMFDLITIWDSGKTEPDTIPGLPDVCTMQKSEITPEQLLLMAGSACRCLYRARLVQDIRFPVGIKFSEDRIFNLYAMGKMDTLRYIRKGLYFRVMQDESAVHRYHEDYFEACLAAHEGTQKALAEAWPDEAYRVAYGTHLIYGAIGAINNYCYKTSPLTNKQRLEKTKILCNNEKLQNALQQTGYGGLRGKLLRKKVAFALLLLAKAANIKNRR